MNNFGGAANQGIPALPTTDAAANRSGLPIPESPYGHRRFSNNEEANTFINTVLNQGNGFTGTVASARNLSQVTNSQRQLLPLSENFSRFNGAAVAGPGGEPCGPMTGPLVNIGRNVGLHGPRIVQRALNRFVPAPSSHFMVVANVDTPIRPEPAGFNRSRFNSSPTSSTSSLSSLNSFASYDSSPCQCPNCTGCLCHRYCAHHAQRKCPVHGLGIVSSDDESGWLSSQSSTSSVALFGFGGSNNHDGHSSSGEARGFNF